MNFGLSKETLNQIRKIVEENPKYKFKIFGSRVKNTYKRNSDIDIAVFENVSKEDEYKIRVPMINTTTRSLNVANTVNIILYEALRQVGFLNMK